MGARKDKLIEETLKKPFEPNDAIIVTKKGNRKYHKVFRIKSVHDGYVRLFEDYFDDMNVDFKLDEIEYYVDNLGFDPMEKYDKYINMVSSCEVTIGELVANFKNVDTVKGVVVPEYNFNPYVLDKDGNKVYFQRDYCWTIEDEQSFIESIYNDLDCGSYVVREHSYSQIMEMIDSGETELGWSDIIDGKQRLNTIRRFINDEFTDRDGNYYSDLSVVAQRRFRNRKALKLVRLGDRSTYEDIIATFLRVNYAGKPMSKEHIEYVQSIYKML